MTNIKQQKFSSLKYSVFAFSLPLFLVVSANAQSVNNSVNRNISYPGTQNFGYNQHNNNNNWNNNNWNHNWNSNDTSLNNDTYNYINARMNGYSNQQKINQLTNLVSLINQKISSLRTSNNQGYGNGWYR